MMIAALALALAVQDPRVETLADYGLTITFPAQFTDIAPLPANNPQLKGRWKGKLEGASLEIDLYVLASDEFSFAEPDDVTEITLENVRDPARGDPGFWFEKTELVPGPFGWASYGSIGWGPLHDKTSTTLEGTLFVLGGLLENNGYSLEVFARPALAEADAKVVVDFLKTGVVYKGAARNPKWTDEEARERWTRHAPEPTHKKFEKPLRSEHYIILTNSSSGKKFGEAMEKCYAAVQKTYPFPDVPGQRLMPVFLFRTPDEYYEFFAKIANVTVEEARRSKGHASRDYYATWFEALNDPVHVHEGTHQIFGNRLHLNGGGSWFQEGVAEYMSSTANERNPSASRVKKGKNVPLAEFMKMRSLLYSSNKDDPKGDAASENYLDAALLIEFLREGKWGKAHFQDFLQTVGRIADNDVAAIERGLKSVYGSDLKVLEDQWVEYCKKR